MVLSAMLKLLLNYLRKGTYECAFLSIHNKNKRKSIWTVFSGPFPKFNSPMH